MLQSQQEGKIQILISCFEGKGFLDEEISEYCPVVQRGSFEQFKETKKGEEKLRTMSAKKQNIKLANPKFEK